LQLLADLLGRETAGQEQQDARSLADALRQRPHA